MNIGTAKPTNEEQAAAPHYLISHVSIRDTYSVGQYEEDAMKILSDLYKHQDIAIVVGGTGLYLKALLEGIDAFPKIPRDIFDTYQSLLTENGIVHLQEELKVKDPIYYHEVDKNNPHRLIRALCVIAVSGRPFSSFLNKKKINRPFIPILIAITQARQQLYKRINERVDLMLKEGLIQEVEKLLPHSELNSLNTVGYKELISHLREECTLERAVEKIKQHTRNYAKRQVTWFKNQQDYNHFRLDELESIEKFISVQMRSS